MLHQRDLLKKFIENNLEKVNFLKFRSSHQRCSVKKGVLRNFKNFQEKTCARDYFLIKLQALAFNFIKKESLTQVFSCEFSEISKNTFFTNHLWATASESY